MSFKKNYVSAKIYGKTVQLTADLEYFDDSIGVIVVPKGFKTSKYTSPEILHDYLCNYGSNYGMSRKQVDKIFYDTLIESGVSRLAAKVAICYNAIKRWVNVSQR